MHVRDGAAEGVRIMSDGSESSVARVLERLHVNLARHASVTLHMHPQLDGTQAPPTSRCKSSVAFSMRHTSSDHMNADGHGMCPRRRHVACQVPVAPASRVDNVIVGSHVPICLTRQHSCHMQGRVERLLVSQYPNVKSVDCAPCIFLKALAYV